MDSNAVTADTPRTQHSIQKNKYYNRPGSRSPTVSDQTVRCARVGDSVPPKQQVDVSEPIEHTRTTSWRVGLASRRPPITTRVTGTDNLHRWPTITYVRSPCRQVRQHSGPR